MFDSNYVMSCSNLTTYAENTPKNTNISGNILNESTSTYYGDKNDSFEILFQQYISSAVNNIYHTAIVE